MENASTFVYTTLRKEKYDSSGKKVLRQKHRAKSQVIVKDERFYGSFFVRIQPLTFLDFFSQNNYNYDQIK
ncbi:hypothetical protein DP117_18450 [Brasilonema sp. UFV-L1]|nr:hypothetical protein [Brasilonema sp. UFV-L1]